jgi:oxygen-independent coproporphyrinogen-3 oxidase
MTGTAVVEDWQTGGFGLYVHWPFCQSKCPYCDFNSHVSAQIDQKQWEVAYLREIARLGAQTEGRVLQTVFFGGGTPSLMDPDLVQAMLQSIKSTWRVANDIEITMEANPGSVEVGRFKAYREAGVNRVSVGVQALNDADLKALGRLHSARDAKAAVEIAQATFDRVSFDLIYARQKQSLEDWRRELREALAMAGGHLSLYQLTIEDGTAFGDRFRRGLLRGLPNEDLGADMYFLTEEMTNAAGFESYEVSNYAKKGQESRHNTLYWNAGDYVGIGPGAHGRLTLGGSRMATETIANPKAWLSSVMTGAEEEVRIQITPTEQGVEYLMMGLRRKDGIALDRFRQLSGADLSPAKIADLTDLGMVICRDGRLLATLSGRLVLNSVIERLMN